MSFAANRRLRLPRSLRMQHRREFLETRQNGLRAVSGCLIANWLRLPAGPSRLGVVTSRSLGGAVVRNRARRLLRECFRLHQHELVHPVALVLVARRSIVGKALESVQKDLCAVLRQARLLEHPPAPPAADIGTPS